MDEKTILITGAGSGIGRATARRFLEAGWRVGLLGRRADALEDSAEGHPGALILPCDVTEADAVDAAATSLGKAWGRLDVLFNNAGIGLPGAPIDEIGVADWQRLCEVNITGMFLVARAGSG